MKLTKNRFVELLVLALTLPVLVQAYTPCYQAEKNTKSAYTRAASSTNQRMRTRLFNDAIELGKGSLQICAVYGDPGGFHTCAINDYISLSYRALNGEEVPVTNNIFEEAILNVWQGHPEKNEEIIKKARKLDKALGLGKESTFSDNASSSTSKQNCTNYKVEAIQLNIRNQPAKASRVVGKVNKDDIVCIYEFSGKWGRVDQGWISEKYLSTSISYNNYNLKTDSLKAEMRGQAHHYIGEYIEE